MRYLGLIPQDSRVYRYIATVSRSTEIKMTRSKNVFWNSDTCIELYFCVEFKSKVLRHKKIIEFSWIFLVVVEYRMTKTANAQNWCEPNSDIDLSQNSKHTTYLKF